MLPAVRHQMEPAFCPLHCSPAPCLHCLAPQVADIICDYHQDEEAAKGYLFLKADMNKN